MVWAGGMGCCARQENKHGASRTYASCAALRRALSPGMPWQRWRWGGRAAAHARLQQRAGEKTAKQARRLLSASSAALCACCACLWRHAGVNLSNMAKTHLAARGKRQGGRAGRRAAASVESTWSR